jgi:SpoVK/Ycf46/Vps4 family AAA+-type ATPase
MPVIPRDLWAQIEEWIQGWSHAEKLREAGLMMPGALLLYGPPGSGKTMLASAILGKMPIEGGVVMESCDVIASYLGESEKNIANAFRDVEASNQMLVIEELDAIGCSRRLSQGSTSQAHNMITITLMRKIEAARVPVIATTNYRERIDEALLRRFELQLEIPVLGEEGRRLLLKKIMLKEPEPELVAKPLVESIRIAHRIRRREFLKSLNNHG